MAAGADCANCPLRNCGAGPVSPSVNASGPVDFLVVSEFPSPADVDAGQILVGPAGREIRQALAAGGYAPERASYTAAILCRPPGGDLVSAEREWKKAGQKSPLVHCKSRLEQELARTRFRLFVGTAAIRAVGIGDSIMRLRGTPLVPDGLATVHPSYVLRDQGQLMRGVFRFDVAKAVRLARGENTWREPTYDVVTKAVPLWEGLNRLDFTRPIAVDTETDGIDPWTCNIRRVGIGDGQRVLIYSPLSVHGNYAESEAERAMCRDVLREFFNLRLDWVFHNYYGYDSTVLAQHGVIVNEEGLYDTLIGHHIGPTSELPHGLDFLGSIYTDARRWKDDTKHSTAKSDEVLDRYLSYDIAVTHVSGAYVKESVRQADQETIYQIDAALSRVGRQMAAVGVGVDAARRKAFVDEYEKKAAEKLGAFCEAAGCEINPGSVPQLKRLLYSDFGLPVLDEHRTDTGEPSTGEPTILDLLARGLDTRASTCLHALLSWREADKILGTYVGRTEAGIKSRWPKGSDRPADDFGLSVQADGRIRATWKVHGTTSGRWSSSPNLQNIPDKLREMFAPRPGNVFVAADYSAVELRILAYLAGDEILIKAFDELDRGVGPDVHTVNACTLFRCTPDKVTKEVRTFAKRFVYGLSYGAGPPKIFQTMSLLRDENLDPVFPGLTLNDVEQVYKLWWTAHPKITAWRSALIKGWRRNGFIATPWHGRKRYFIGGENHEEMYNHPIQGAAADLQNGAVLALTGRYPFNLALSRGLILQVHDQLVVECGADEADSVKDKLARSMHRELGPMRFPAEVKIGKNWMEV